MQYCNVEEAERDTVGKENKGKKMIMRMIEMLRIEVPILAQLMENCTRKTEIHNLEDHESLIQKWHLIC